MKQSTGTPPQTIAPPRPEKTGLNRWILGIVIIAIIIIGALFSLIYYTNAQVSTKTFAYSPAPSQGTQPYNSLTISDVDGLVRINPWSQANLLINGTITAKGLGSTLPTVTISNSTSNGNVVFKAIFPVNPGFFFSQSYTTTINAYVPSSMRFDTIQVSNINGGVQVDNLNSTTTTIFTVNGAVRVNCVYCLNMTVTSASGNVSLKTSSPLTTGAYNLTTTNSNIALNVPSSSSFRAVVHVLNGSIGSIQVVGLPGATTAETYLSQVFGSGGTIVNMYSVTGQVTITGT